MLVRAPLLPDSLAKARIASSPIRAKATAKVTADHIKGLRALGQDHPRIKQRLIVCLEPETKNDILILPQTNFASY
jgi:hypothetical protein